MNDQPIHDNRLKELVQKSGVSPAPDQFAEKVMERIHKEPIPEIPVYRTFLSRRMLWLYAFAVVVIITIVFMVNWSPFNMTPETISLSYYEKLIPYFQTTVAGLSRVFGFLTGSSLPMIIGAGAVLLIALDRILRKLTLKRSYIF